jgi:hypothetical protein
LKPEIPAGPNNNLNNELLLFLKGSFYKRSGRSIATSFKLPPTIKKARVKTQAVTNPISYEKPHRIVAISIPA